jgi:Chalcone isomerase-like
MARRRTLLQVLPLAALSGHALLAAPSAWAQTPPLVPLAAEAAAELLGAQATGAFRMRFFGFNVYDATLWVAPGFRASAYAQHGHALDLAYLRALDGRAIAERSLKEMERQGPISPAQAQSWLGTMLATFPDVKAGDRLTGLHMPGKGARFWFNGQPRAMVADPEFSRRFFGIWLAESTSEPALRTQLLASAAP